MSATATTICTVRAVPGGWELEGGVLDGRFVGHSLKGFEGQRVEITFNPNARGGTWRMISVRQAADEAAELMR